MAVQTPAWREVQINYLGETRLGEEIKITAYNGASGDTLVTGNAEGRASFAALVKM